jgi:Ser/Thr protein kinase RdoA (MazF antagonist)
MPPTDKILSPREAADVLAAWRLKPIFNRPAGGTANAGLVVVTSRGQYFLRRRNPRYSDPQQLAYDHSVLHALARAGLPVPHVVRTADGSRWVRHQDHIYELYELIDGEEADPDSPEEVISSAETLARWHLATRDLSPAGRKAWPRYFDPSQSLRGLQMARLRLQAGDTGDLGDLTPAAATATVNFLSDQARLCARGLPDRVYRTLPATIIHGDWHPANLKFRDHQVCGIFDFDWVGLQPRLIDLTDGLLFFGSRRDAPLNGADIWSLTQPLRPDLERMAAFYQAYTRTISLQREEKQALPDFMRQRCLYIRVDAMTRKVPPADQIRFLVSGVEDMFHWITANEERLRRGLKG